MGIIHIAKACIVGSQDKLHPFRAVCHLILEALVQLAEQLTACMELFFGRGVIVDAVFLHHHRHELHEAKGTFFALEVQLEARLLADE